MTLPDTNATNYWYERAKLADAELAAEKEHTAKYVAQFKNEQLEARVRALEEGVRRIRDDYPPGTFRGLQQECEIWRIADGLLKPAQSAPVTGPETGDRHE